jgi:hypothetical protein
MKYFVCYRSKLDEKKVNSTIVDTPAAIVSDADLREVEQTIANRGGFATTVLIVSLSPLE